MAATVPAPRKLKTLEDVPVDGKRVLLRVDFNVTVGDDGVVDASEDYRIESVLPTLNELRRRRAKIIVLTHFGRPQESGEVAGSDLTPIRRRLEELLGEEVRATKQLTGREVETAVAATEPGGVVLLPNVRLDVREEQGNQNFAAELAALAEVYVNDAFSVSHRAHTSVAFVPHLLPAVAGRRTVLEVETLQRLITEPAHPYVAIVSGAKISTKVGLLRDLLQRVDVLALGGDLANVFLAAEGKYPIDRYSADDVAAAQSLLNKGREKILLPVDAVAAAEGEDMPVTYGVEAIPPTVTGLWDIGPRSAEAICDTCREARTVMWNGPVGRFELPRFAQATERLATCLAELSAYRVVGGGDTVNAIERLRLVSAFDHVSVGGGAMVEFLEGKRMPGLEPLYQTAAE